MAPPYGMAGDQHYFSLSLLNVVFFSLESQNASTALMVIPLTRDIRKKTDNKPSRKICFS